MQDNTRCIDILKCYKINEKGEWHKEFETNNKPSICQRILKFLGWYKCAGDALTNYAINDLAVYTGSKYMYASVGTSSANGTTYSYDDLLSPVMSRVFASAGFISTYNTDPLLPDTVQYTVVMVASGDYVLREAGIHTAITAGYMGSRQTFDDWTIANGESFAMVWQITYGRG